MTVHEISIDFLLKKLHFQFITVHAVCIVQFLLHVFWFCIFVNSILAFPSCYTSNTQYRILSYTIHNTFLYTQYTIQIQPFIHNTQYILIYTIQNTDTTFHTQHTIQIHILTFFLLTLQILSIQFQSLSW